ncbi:hypothetical protein NP233_g8375 [Leucocoprinus birnbaumii]|uniref:Uncharacterized protein n=1 Tax=Leucocoprinus birnbaumii TaxID=56174 RepID=A0AAD5VMJ8_9AGAR|nr:hypothetical protein NP233_g8375 [Leucocoprinus birnbaumii]
MKFLYALLAGLTAVSAQSVRITAPSNGAQVTAGQSTVVQLSLPNHPTPEKQVAVVIGLAPCFSEANYCPPPSDELLNLLYSGPYNPQRPDGNSQTIYQNFTVEIPAGIQKGPAVLGVAHFSLLGAALVPWLETQNVSVVIQ